MFEKRLDFRGEQQPRMLAVTKYALECLGYGEKVNAIDLPKNPEKFEEAFPKTDWLAVIHADGNGLGQIFLDFGEASNCKGPENWCEYLNKLRRFSLALDECTIRAYGFAVNNLYEHLKALLAQGSNKVTLNENGQIVLPLLPLILGGDDLTLICDGRYAIQFAKDFLSEFENETAKNEVIKPIAGNALCVERLSSCAGVAIVKPHFPFHAAYGLAKDLLQSAKTVKSKLQHKCRGESVPYPASALDYHILYDTSSVDLERIRGHLRVDAGERTHLYARPYLVTSKKDLENFRAGVSEERHEADEWRERRYWTELEKRVNAMKAKEERNPNRRLLPNGMLHDLREGLFMGKEVADGRMKLARPRYQNNPEQKAAFDALLCKSDSDAEDYSLFCSETIKEGDTKKQICVTGFLKAVPKLESGR